MLRSNVGIVDQIGVESTPGTAVAANLIKEANQKAAVYTKAMPVYDCSDYYP